MGTTCLSRWISQLWLQGKKEQLLKTRKNRLQKFQQRQAHPKIWKRRWKVWLPMSMIPLSFASVFLCSHKQVNAGKVPNHQELPISSRQDSFFYISQTITTWLRDTPTQRGERTNINSPRRNFHLSAKNRLQNQEHQERTTFYDMDWINVIVDY